MTAGVYLLTEQQTDPIGKKWILAIAKGMRSL